MRNVIVTGGSRGLGLGIAHKLATDGYRVIAIARSETPALSAASKHLGNSGAGGALEFRAFDLTDLGGIPGLVKSLRKQFGSIHGLVNNAGVGTSGILATMPDSAIESLLKLNVLSPLILTKYVVRTMLADGRGGRIVNISSVIGSTGYSGLSVYAATKASLLGFTRSLAREVGQLGINVNAVAPGFVDTEMTSGMDAAQREKIVRRSALRRLPGVDDVAHAVQYLLDDRSKNVTGTVLTVDAGNTA